MKRKHILFLTGILAAAMLTGCKPQTAKAPEPTAAAADPREKVIAAYQTLLAESPALEGEHPELEDASFGYEENLAKFGKHYDYFAVSDLNQDGTPELIAMTVINNRWTPVSVFTCSENGEAVLLKDPADPAGHATFEQMSTAGGEYTFYICKNNHLHNLWSGDTPIGYQEENHAYALTAAALAPTDCGLTSTDIAARFADMAVKNTEANRNAIH